VRIEGIGIESWRERLKISVTARPRGGEANREVLQALAEWTGVRVSEMSIVSGHSSRRKSVRIEGIGIESWRERLKISVTARPRGGEANREVLQALAEWTGVRVSEMSIVSGHSSRRKSVRIEGIGPNRISALLEG
jgi:uncharacterized protein (TIGR00251 family)